MSEADLKRDFEARKPSLDALGAYVNEYVKNKMIADPSFKSTPDKFFQIPPKHRVKETDSFLEKALVRKPKENPLIDIKDQVGIRFVVLLLENIDYVGKIVQSGPWDWQKDRDHERERLDKPDYFAYQSDHYVITTNNELEIEGNIIPAGISCEIQIRTILQHAYAEMAHSCDYKPSIKLPDETQRHVKRSLAKGSALIETTDGVFAEVIERIKEYSESVDILLEKSSEIYAQLIHEPRTPITMLGIMIADTYREKLQELTPAALETWSQTQTTLSTTLLRKRPSSVFYRDPAIILIAWLICKSPTSVPRNWPVEMRYLENLYLDLGMSTEGLF